MVQRCSVPAPCYRLPETSSGSSWSHSFLPELVSGRGTARRSRVVEGQACSRRIDDIRRAGFSIAHYIGSWNAKRFDSGRREEGIPPCVAAWPVAHIVRDTIDLDAQSCIAAIEIENEIITTVLTSEFEAIGARLKYAPQQHFRKRHLSAQSAGFPNGAGGRFRCNIPEHRIHPSTMLRMVPLPETSSGRI